MNFKEAYKAMQEGKKVRRKGEGGRGDTLYYNFELNCIYFKNKFKNKIAGGRYFFTTTENALAEDWEVIEEKKEYWKPKKDEKYFCIEEYIQGVGSDVNGEWNIDDFRFNMGNYFKTKEEAEHMVEKLKVIHELQKFAYENNEREIDWNNENQEKHVILYSNNRKELDITCVNSSKYLPFNIYFASKETALKAIEEIGADRIKKYYFDVEE